MGIFSEIKKLLFASTSVAKSAADMATDSINEAGNELGNKTKDAFNSASEQLTNKTSGLRDSVLDKADDLWEQSKDMSTDAIESLKNNDLTKQVTDKLGDLKDDLANNDMVKKAAAFTESIGVDVIGKGNELLDKAGDVAGDLGDKANVLKDKIVDRANEIKEDVSEKVDDMVAKEKVAEAIDESKIEGGFAKETLNTGDSLLKGTDDFFSRASKFADGEHDAFNEGKMDITQGTPETKTPAIAAGFTDLDGDGNEMIDDALVIGEEE